MGTTICSLNANGLRAADKRGFETWLHRSQPDILCLQELRAWPDQVKDPIRCPAGYNTRWQVASKKGYAGVAVYSRHAVDSYQATCGLDWADDEGRFLRADFADLSVISCYLPSGSSGEERQRLKFEFMEYFQPLAKKLAREKRPIVFCGDLNIAHTEIDIHNPKGNAKNSGFLPEEREWFSQLLKGGWVDTFRAAHPDEVDHYSWWSNRGRARELNRGWRLDYLLANRAMAPLVERAWIEPDAGLSDHAPVWIELRDEE